MLILLAPMLAASGNAPDDSLIIDNGTVRVGIDRAKGGAIAWLSWRDYPTNAVNVADPGRLIQQSYYAGKALDRTIEGQSRAWSPWAWNPIQGGGVGSWARVVKFERSNNVLMHSETIPKLWDMPNEEAAAVMRQWTSFEPGFSNAVLVHCQFVSRRPTGDRWGAGGNHAQEVPACYFTRYFGAAKSYLGDGRWRVESQPPGPPWGQAVPPRKAMAVFNPKGQGIAIFSPIATQPWNFGPHGQGDTANPTAGPCMHVAPLDRVKLGPQAEYSYRYWLLTGTEAELADALEILWQRHATEKASFGNNPASPAPGERPNPTNQE